ncbi:serine/threonine-protein kinase [Actinocorallia sp. A-T 12471]|uniref:serine/threonine protein kinase n=1 Tax=Actinocorallia sp. A-T 12471 TaxID=3089813 RepID=UPI0029D402C2|nr:serine/threonine-protein kinase [Actinocorallia sp. A-T 12471]MDX6744973.1 serine/threonine-protein kinase [Actinocorallia sp. A-T 12471]
MPEAHSLRPGDPVQLGPYRLVGRLGEGGQGVVYLATAASGEQVAVKRLHTRFSGDNRARAAFAHELQAAQKVDPFCTARILTADVEGDVPYIASEYIHGLSLKRTVEEWGPRAGSQLNRLAIGTATALVAIHKAGVVHRDFKPSNVILGPDGPRVIDFGVARALDLTTASLSTGGGPLGTPAYMAPEQFARAPVDRPVDVFAWASTLVYASCGEPPFGNDSISVVINRILHTEPDLGTLTGGLRELAEACLAKDPAARPTAEQLLFDLIGTGRSDDPFPAAAASPVPPTRERTTLASGADRSGHSNPTVSRSELRAIERERARRKNSLRYGVVGGVMAVAAVAVAATVVLTGGGHAEPEPPSPSVMATGGATSQVRPPTGPVLELRSTDDFTYTIGAAGGGTEEIDGAKYAYADYFIANAQDQPVPMEYPGDLFIERAKAPKGVACMDQPGAPDSRCTVPNEQTVKALLDGSEAPLTVDGDEYMAPGASYLIRVRTKDPVPGDVKAADIGVYVWDVRFFQDRKARHIEFPG